jgi:hypothetical protein
MEIKDNQIVITIDAGEIISLRNARYLEDNEIEDKEAITEAIHTLISDIWKTKPNYREDCWF